MLMLLVMVVGGTGDREETDEHTKTKMCFQSGLDCIPRAPHSSAECEVPAWPSWGSEQVCHDLVLWGSRLPHELTVTGLSVDTVLQVRRLIWAGAGRAFLNLRRIGMQN